jgi:hypothetical protein
MGINAAYRAAFGVVGREYVGAVVFNHNGPDQQYRPDRRRNDAAFGDGP